MTRVPTACALTKDSSAADLAERGGGKAQGLHRLSGAGIDVPEWAVIGTDVFDRFVADNDLAEPLAALVEGLDSDNADAVAQQASELILSGELDHETRAMVLDAYQLVGSGVVAVRSSGAEEDSGELSFAGQFASYLNVQGDDEVVEHVRLCWASAYTARALQYRAEHNVVNPAVRIAVIVQRLVAADRSGVMFTANPTTGRRDQLVVSAVYGLGEGLVSGAVDADTVVVDRMKLRPPQWTVGEKSQRYDAAPGTGLRVSEVPESETVARCLSDAEVAELFALGERLEEVFGAPQDVEWALEAGRLVVLQSRPVTSLPPEAETTRAQLVERVLIWDNSNIVENFGGISTPLTFSFARHVYHAAHQEYCRMLRVPDRQLREMDDWQRNRLGYFHGRVYYNLLTWYRMQRLLPLAQMKHRVMELSMGVADPIADDVVQRLTPCTYRSRREELTVRGRAAAVFGWQFALTDRYVKRFLDEFYEVFERFERIDYDRLPADEVFRHYMALDRELLPKWAPMVGLEAIILTGFGLLLGLTKKWLPDAPTWLHWKVASPGEGTESVQPARVLRELADVVLADPELAAVITSAEPEQIRQRLEAGGHREFLASVDSYIDKFGYRSLDELKLEEPDLRENSDVFYDMLRGAMASVAGRDTDHGADEEVERYLAEHLSAARRPIYERMRGKVRHALRSRESVRFCRTRVFGLARRMFRAIGRDLARMGALEAERDVFYLHLEEIRGCFEGTIGHGDLAELVAMRKRAAAADAQLTAPERFVTAGPVYWDKGADAAWLGDGSLEDGQELVAGSVLRGTPCSYGTAEGIARVVTAPKGIDGGVLVTYRTDPGWVGVLPSASALLIERGSPLTHVAIVARELGIPTVVQIKNLVNRVQNGTRLRVDGGTGEVHVLDLNGTAPEAD